MDCGGQFERDGRVMSQVPMGGVDLCDNLHRPETLAAQTRNLNEANTLTQTSNPCSSQNEEEQEHRIILNTSLNNNAKGEEVQEVDKQGNIGKGTEDEEEEDTDEVMKEAPEEEEEDEESEESSALIHCQSPDTPMTDSSYSETGSLLESPYPFSPGTSPEPTSPIVPVSPLSDTEVDSQISITHPTTVGDTAADSLPLTSDTRPTSSPVFPCVSGTTDSTAESVFTAEHTSFTSSTEHRPTCTRGPATSHAEPQASRLSTFVASTTGSETTSTEPTSTAGPINLHWGHITSMSVPPCFSVSTCTTGPIQCTSPLECLEQLAHKGDDTRLPQYLHQIAETFVLHEDYQRALWCLQLERLYHQRVLDNLNTLQEQWESKCRTSSSLEIQHLDSLKHICLTHSRPVAGDAVSASTLEEGGAKRISAHQVDGGIKQRTEDSSRSQPGHSITPSINVSDEFKAFEISKRDKEDPNRELQGRGSFHGSQLTDMEHSDNEKGRAQRDVGHTITVIGNGLHPPTAGVMDQSKPAEQQGGDLGLTQGREAKVEEEETDVEVAVEALEMKDEEEEEQKDRDAESAQKDLPVETVVSGSEMGAQQHQESQDSEKTHLNQEAHSQEENVKQQEPGEEEEEDGEEEVYEEEQADIIKEAATLDDMAKLITVEEMSPASGLVSILKRRSVCMDNVSTTTSSDLQPEKPTAKRRVRFKVPDDGYEQDVGGGDSCLLLFLLCLVTVVISVGGTALYCALGDVHSSVCQDFSRNADFYIGQIQRGITHIHHWFAPGS
ncbi:consortin [Betta splendens]|uniref:Consortin n=1 Tax=Betta splendens TaxID=158456 RepID=A0A6P7M2R0_BETSP|nr:consortin [Betta splendens]